MTHHFFTRFSKSAVCSGILLTLLVVSLCAGCKRSTTAESPDGAKVTVKGTNESPEIAFKNQKGEEVHYAGGTKSVALPADFPSDVAVYSGAQPVLSSAGDESIVVVLKTTDSIEKIEKFYKDKLKESGWKTKGTMSMPQEFMLEGTKEGRTLMVMTTSEKKGTMIQLTIGKKAK